MNAAGFPIVNAVATQHRIAARMNLYSRLSIAKNFVVFQYALAILINVYAPSFAIMNAIAPQRGIAAFTNRYVRVRIREDVVVLQRTLAIFINKNTCTLSIVDAIATQSRVSSSVDRDARQTLAGDVASLQVEAPLSNIDAVPFPTAYLSQRQICNSPHVRLKPDHISSPCLDNYFTKL